MTSPAGTSAGRRIVSYRDVFWLAVAQWPASFVILAWVRAFPQPAWKADLGVMILCVVSAVVWLGNQRGRGGLARVLIAAGCQTCAILLAFRDSKIEVSLVLVGATLLVMVGALFRAAHRRSAGLAFALSLTLFAMFVVEAVTEPWSGVQPAFTETTSGKIAAPDERLTKRLIPGAQSHNVGKLADGTTIFDVTYHIGPDGTRRVTGRPDAGPVWAAVGCSYTFGLALNDEQTIPQRLQDRFPRARVFNQGVGGFGTAEVLIHLQEILNDQSDTRLVIYFFIDDHIRRVALPHYMIIQDWGRAKPLYRLEEGRAVYAGKASDHLSAWERASINVAARSWIWNRLVRAFGSRVTGRDADLVAQLILNMNDECRRAPDCRFVVVRLPQDRVLFDMALVDRQRWRDQLAAAGIPVWDFEPVFLDHMAKTRTQMDDYFVVYDGHPRPRLVELLVAWLEPQLNGLTAGAAAAPTTQESAVIDP